MASKRGGPRTAGPGKRIGRPRKDIAEKRPNARGLVTVRIDLETAALAQRLMLQDWPGVASVEDLFSYALRRLGEE